jgi:hypothetical protein
MLRSLEARRVRIQALCGILGRFFSTCVVFLDRGATLLATIGAGGPRWGDEKLRLLDRTGHAGLVVQRPLAKNPTHQPWRDEKSRLPHRTDHAGIVAQRTPVTDPPTQPSPTRGEGFLRPRRLAACQRSSKQKRLPRLVPICRIDTEFSSAHPNPPPRGERALGASATGGVPTSVDTKRSRQLRPICPVNANSFSARAALDRRPRAWLVYTAPYISAFRAWTNAVESELEVPWSAWSDDASR